MTDRVYVARQPIFDQARRVFGYELLFRSGAENVFRGDVDGSYASKRVIKDSLHAFGLDTLLEGQSLGFINFTESLILDETYTLLPKERVVVELLESVQPTPEVVAACEALKAKGYVLALDDFVFAEEYRRLLPLADIVKIDFIATVGEDRQGIAERLRAYPKIRLLAEKVETHADFRQAVDVGYAYFQGYFFCKPEIVSAKDLPASKLNYLSLIRELNDPSCGFDKLAEIIRLDVALSVKLLRYLNSAAFGLRQKVTSVRHAISMLGERPFRKWASLVALSAMADDKPGEVMTTAMVRARFCEQVGRLAGLVAADTDMFFVGMLSMVDVVLSRPLDEILSQLNVSSEITRTLLMGEPALALAVDPPPAEGGREHRVLRTYAIVRAYERADFPTVERLAHELGLDADAIAQRYLDSVAWAADMQK